ncbi:hypothetical protein BDP27DRAFT_1535461 [Rhodocollybia butyracea]|uniref:Uncharacterized protein n=1 Tax=Rhodocollybia butyracea TaxID=206335 RepID=A0A9P5PS56_9AGAR|nr:hypothetical protein BDP27DRAFT_1535461 [Rhodocollybia butyracea]
MYAVAHSEYQQGQFGEKCPQTVQEKRGWHVHTWSKPSGIAYHLAKDVPGVRLQSMSALPVPTYLFMPSCAEITHSGYNESSFSGKSTSGYIEMIIMMGVKKQVIVLSTKTVVGAHRGKAFTQISLAVQCSDVPEDLLKLLQQLTSGPTFVLNGSRVLINSYRVALGTTYSKIFTFSPGDF